MSLNYSTLSTESSALSSGELYSESPESGWQGISYDGWVKVIVVGVLMALTFHPNLIRLWAKTNPFYGEPNWRHAIVVPLIGIYYLFVHRDEMELIKPNIEWSGLAILIFGLLAFAMGIHPIQNDFIKDFGMVVAIFGVVTFLCGWRMMKIAWFPIVFLLCAVPWPDQIYSQVASPLQNLAAKVAVRVLNATNVEAANVGTKIIVIGDKGAVRTLNVAEACAGLRSLMTFISTAAAVAFLSTRPFWQKLIVSASAVPIAIFCNVMRVSGQGILDHYVSQQWSEGFAHMFVGIVMLVPGFLFILMVGWMLDMIFVEVVDDHQPQKQNYIRPKETAVAVNNMAAATVPRTSGIAQVASTPVVTAQVASSQAVIAQAVMAQAMKPIPQVAPSQSPTSPVVAAQSRPAQTRPANAQPVNSQPVQTPQSPQSPRPTAPLGLQPRRPVAGTPTAANPSAGSSANPVGRAASSQQPAGAVPKGAVKAPVASTQQVAVQSNATVPANPVARPVQKSPAAPVQGMPAKPAIAVSLAPTSAVPARPTAVSPGAAKPNGVLRLNPSTTNSPAPTGRPVAGTGVASNPAGAGVQVVGQPTKGQPVAAGARSGPTNGSVVTGTSVTPPRQVSVLGTDKARSTEEK